MSTAIDQARPVITHDQAEAVADTTSAIPALQMSTAAIHPRAAEIVRQIDHYFSDDNLRQDAHLLGLFKEGNGTVSLNEVLGFKKMRQYKPRTAVKEAVKLSTVIEVVQVGTKDRLRLRKAPQKSITVVPKINKDRQKIIVPEDKPWLTKGIMKPTGFEEFATSGPIRPEEYEEDRKEYDPDNAFFERIETAVRKFCQRRKMHTDTRLIFEQYMIYGGMDSGTGQFTGGVDDRMKEKMTKKEISEMNQKYSVSERVLDGFFEDGEGEDGEKSTYVVDFEASAKGFLSSRFPAIANWYDSKQVMTATMVLRNFFNYLLLHGVCSEYTDQLRAAFKVCDLAEEELIKLAIVDQRLPGGFNKACSTLFEGNFADKNAADGDWAIVGDDIGWTNEQAKLVFLTGLFAYGTKDQLNRIEEIQNSGDNLTEAIKVINKEESMGLEVVAVERTTDAARQIYNDPQLGGTLVKPMGKLRCKRWEVPHAKLDDLPEWLLEQRKKHVEFDVLLEDQTLEHCFLGMKMEACVKELSIGAKFIDYHETVYVSFFTWLWNERIRDWKEPGPLTAWMERQNAIKLGNAVGESVLPEEFGDGMGQDEHEMPD